jgi:excisionase family DNA binding protein
MDEKHPAPNEQGPRLMSTCAAARALAISERHLRTLAARGHLRLVRLGRRCLVERASIDALIARGGTP